MCSTCIASFSQNLKSSCSFCFIPMEQKKEEFHPSLPDFPYSRQISIVHSVLSIAYRIINRLAHLILMAILMKSLPQMMKVRYGEAKELDYSINDQLRARDIYTQHCARCHRDTVLTLNKFPVQKGQKICIWLSKMKDKFHKR